jgi:hypothetical protein
MKKLILLFLFSITLVIGYSQSERTYILSHLNGKWTEVTPNGDEDVFEFDVKGMKFGSRYYHNSVFEVYEADKKAILVITEPNGNKDYLPITKFTPKKFILSEHYVFVKSQ